MAETSSLLCAVSLSAHSLALSQTKRGPKCNSPVIIRAIRADDRQLSTSRYGDGEHYLADMVAATTGASRMDYRRAYPSEVRLAPKAVRGFYESPAYDWTVPARLEELRVAAELGGGRIATTVEILDNGFKTVLANAALPVNDGPCAYPLQRMEGQAVRVLFDFPRHAPNTPSPVLDGSRSTAEPTKVSPR